MNKIWKKPIIVAVALLLVAVISFGPLSSHFSKPETYSKTIETLDDKKENVLLMTASSAGASAALSAIPFDIADPIANELADLSSTFMLVLGAIFLEKYILTLAGVITFKFLIPIACLLMIAYIFSGREVMTRIAIKLALFGICIMLVIPLSTAATNFIEKTNEVSIEQTVEKVDNAVEDIEDKEEDEGFFSETWDKIKGGVAGALDKIKNSIGNFVEATAILIITSCVIPILTLMLLVWIIKMLFGISINLSNSKLKGLARSGSRARQNAIKKIKYSRKNNLIE